MSWLAEQKAKVELEKSEKHKKDAAEQAAYESRKQSSIERAKQEYKNKFADLEGKTCWQEVDNKKKKLGKFRAEIKEHCITLFAGDVKMASIDYWFRESVQYDSDGGSYGTGDYYETSYMWLYLPYTKKDGTKVEVKSPKYGGASTSYHGEIYGDYLGEYLLNFIKL